ncbi:tRNA pseudouridine(13) synthase TruD [Lysinibacter sp. HNR]|uniref:tRNA pseudouridine(13) synthase TruD n=1 Tax=Lysinibacter sp. HNR TaxID=3031408 RepID=UPI0024355AA2|nr:tRNA pseudouridine(13) synthase TruD [Lysinibacter sp. HNR]WGD37595.1 tRNA pseudouridine(13) synthase TruD [Lysinibacter sp. HNR]
MSPTPDSIIGIPPEFTPPLADAALKTTPEDFVVHETPRFHLESRTSANKQISSLDSRYNIFLVSKRNLTTFQAIGFIADALNIGREKIGYAGLKDENAITHQYFSIPETSTLHKDELFTDQDKYLRVTFIGTSREPISVGDLFGNSFNITVRNIAESDLAYWPTESKRHFEFINYYDTQRFGVPTGPSQTHLIGKYLQDKEFDNALPLVAASGSAEALAAQQHTGTAVDFFDSLDQRITSFYRSAHYSFLWNSSVADRLREISPVEKVYRDGIEYSFPQEDNFASLPLASPYTTVRLVNSSPTALHQERAVRVNTLFHLEAPKEDSLHPGKYCATISFFLPSGSYATMAIAQFLRVIGAKAQ